MNKHILYTFLACGAYVTSAQAVVSINLSGNPTTGPQFVVGTANSTFVPDGSLIRVGTFETAPAAGATFEQLSSLFREFARTTVGHTSGSAPLNQGRVNRSGVASDPTSTTSPDPDSYFSTPAPGKTIYIWVYNAATDSLTVPQGIFSTSQSPFVDEASAKSVSVNSFLTAYGTATGWTPTTVDSNAGVATFFHLSAPVIPEPSTVVTLGLLTVFGLARRRR